MKAGQRVYSIQQRHGKLTIFPATLVEWIAVSSQTIWSWSPTRWYWNVRFDDGSEELRSEKEVRSFTERGYKSLLKKGYKPTPKK